MRHVLRPRGAVCRIGLGAKSAATPRNVHTYRASAEFLPHENPPKTGPNVPLTCRMGAVSLELFGVPWMGGGASWLAGKAKVSPMGH